MTGAFRLLSFKMSQPTNQQHTSNTERELKKKKMIYWIGHIQRVCVSVWLYDVWLYVVWMKRHTKRQSQSNLNVFTYLVVSCDYKEIIIVIIIYRHIVGRPGQDRIEPVFLDKLINDQWFVREKALNSNLRKKRKKKR